MKKYGKVEVAIDLGEYSEDLIERALAVTESPSAVHIVFVHQRADTIYTEVGPMGSAVAQFSTIEDRLRQDLEDRLRGWAEAYDIPVGNAHFLVGKPSSQILEFARANDIELIVIGTHSRKGLQRLLGSTAHSVLQHGERDVLAIHAD